MLSIKVLITFYLGVFAISQKVSTKPMQALNVDALLENYAREDYCNALTSSREIAEMCHFNSEISIERAALCYERTSSIVAEALCLVNGQSMKRVTSCFENTPTYLEEQDCLTPITGLSLGQRIGVTSRDLEEAIEALIKYDVQLAPQHEAYEILSGQFNI